MSKLFPTKEAAKILGKSVRTLRRWVKSGKLSRSVAGDKNFGTGDMFSEDDLKKCLKNELIDNEGKKSSSGAGDILKMTKTVTQQKMQIQGRIEKIMSSNDKISKSLFNLYNQAWQDTLQNGEEILITEAKIKGEEIYTSFILEKVGKADISRPLTEYDRAVFDACISAYLTLGEYAPIDSILRILTGSKHTGKPLPAQKETFLASLEKMMTTLIRIDFSETREKIPKYDEAPPKFVSPVLPCEYLDNVEVNGKKTAVIHFHGESALLKIAKAKKQIISYPAALLDIPNQNNTPIVIAIKSYVILRVMEIIKHNMTPTITFDDVFQKCGLADADNWKKQDARAVISRIMKHLQAEGVIKKFETIKQNGKFYAITFSS